MEDIKKHKVTNSYINQDRSFVYLDIPFNGKKTIPRAHYNWLLGNPQFEDVPPGYCVHHLDLDELNDDISNLVIMKLNHHNAYHFKLNKNNDYEKVKLRAPVRLGENPSVPIVRKVSGAGKTELWTFRWMETDFSGKRVSRQITKIKDKPFRTEKEANQGKRLFMKLHPYYSAKADTSRIENLIYQINTAIDPEEVQEAYDIIKKTFPKI